MQRWTETIVTNYIHVNLNHPPSVIKEIPRSMEKSSQFYHHQKEFLRSQPFNMKNALKTVGIKLS